MQDVIYHHISLSYSQWRLCNCIVWQNKLR